MVSSKCLKTSSPSPLRFLAALMPPWAQTECERLTGTMEKRSTLPPASAILMTAARPARPPPTTMILGVAAAMFAFLLLLISNFQDQKTSKPYDFAIENQAIGETILMNQRVIAKPRFVSLEGVVFTAAFPHHLPR